MWRRLSLHGGMRTRCDSAHFIKMLLHKDSKYKESFQTPSRRNGEGPRHSLCVSLPLSECLLCDPLVCPHFWGWDIWFLGQEKNERNMIIQSLFYYPHSQRRILPLTCSVLDFCGIKLGQQIEWQNLRNQQGCIGLHCKGGILPAKETSNVLEGKKRGTWGWEQRFQVCLCFLGLPGSSFFLNALGLLAWRSSWLLLISAEEVPLLCTIEE